MPLRRRFVIHRALGEAKAVMHLRVYLNLARCARFFEQFFQFLDHRQGGEIVILGAGDIELAFDLAQCEVRTLFRVVHQPGAVQ